jgi:hypothetical protein
MFHAAAAASIHLRGEGGVCWHLGDLTHQDAYFWKLAHVLGTTSLSWSSSTCSLVFTGSLCVPLQPAQLSSLSW